MNLPIRIYVGEVWGDLFILIGRIMRRGDLLGQACQDACLVARPPHRAHQGVV